MEGLLKRGDIFDKRVELGLATDSRATPSTGRKPVTDVSASLSDSMSATPQTPQTAQRPPDDKRPSVPMTPTPSTPQTGTPATRINQPNPRFTVMVWNIENYGDNKIDANPFANLIIHDVMQAVDCDLLLILESESSPGDIVTALRHLRANPLLAKGKGKSTVDIALKSRFTRDEKQQLQNETKARPAQLAVEETDDFNFFAVSSEPTGKTKDLPRAFGPYQKKKGKKKKADDEKDSPADEKDSPADSLSDDEDEGDDHDSDGGGGSATGPVARLQAFYSTRGSSKRPAAFWLEPTFLEDVLQLYDLRLRRSRADSHKNDLTRPLTDAEIVRLRQAVQALSPDPITAENEKQFERRKRNLTVERVTAAYDRAGQPYDRELLARELERITSVSTLRLADGAAERAQAFLEALERDAVFTLRRHTRRCTGERRSAADEEKRPWRKVIGIRNDGRSCYLNAVLQLLARLDLDFVCPLSEKRIDGVADGPLATAARDFIDTMNREAASGEYLSATRPLDREPGEVERIFTRAEDTARLRGLLAATCLWDSTEDSEDAHEALLAILEAIALPRASADDEQLELAAIFYEVENARPAPARRPEIRRSMLHFAAKTTTTYDLAHADLCEKERPPAKYVTVDAHGRHDAYENMNELDVALPEGDDPLDLTDLLNAAFDQRGVAPKQACRVGTGSPPVFVMASPVRRQLFVEQVDRYLILRLTRMRLGHKITRSVDMDDSITLVLGPDRVEYHLAAFIYHDGDSPRDGHYIAFVNWWEQWYCINDNVVMQIDDDQVRYFRDRAYVFLYDNDPGKAADAEGPPDEKADDEKADDEKAQPQRSSSGMDATDDKSPSRSMDTERDDGDVEADEDNADEDLAAVSLFKDLAELIVAPEGSLQVSPEMRPSSPGGEPTGLSLSDDSPPLSPLSGDSLPGGSPPQSPRLPPAEDEKRPRYCHECHEPSFVALVKEKLATMIGRRNTETYVAIMRIDPRGRGRLNEPVRARLPRFVRFHPYRHQLLSTDSKNAELGYRDPESPFNGRCPYYLELEMPTRERPVRMPIVLFHTPYSVSAAAKARLAASASTASTPATSATPMATSGSSPTTATTPSTAPSRSAFAVRARFGGDGFIRMTPKRPHEIAADELRMRADSLRALLDLGIPSWEQERGPTAFREFPNAIIAADFNLDIADDKEKAIYVELGRAGFLPTVHRTRSSLATIDAVLPVSAEDKAALPDTEWLNHGYDNILFKGTVPLASDPTRISGGVVDVFDVIATSDRYVDNSDVDAMIADYRNYNANKTFPKAKNKSKRTPETEDKSDRHGPILRAANEKERWRRANPRQRAMMLYRRYVSDHLPVYLDIPLDPMSREPASSDGGGRPAEQRLRRPFIGIENPVFNNVCYLNSILQLLYRLNPLENVVLPRGGDTFSAIIDLFLGQMRDEARTGDYLIDSRGTRAENQTAAEQIYTTQSSFEVRDTLDTVTHGRFPFGRQCDAQEALTVILDHYSLTTVNITVAHLRTLFDRGDARGLLAELPTCLHFMVCATTEYRIDAPKSGFGRAAIHLERNNRNHVIDCRQSLELPVLPRRNTFQLAWESLRTGALLDRSAVNCWAYPPSSSTAVAGLDGRASFSATPTAELITLVSYPRHLLVVMKRFDNYGNKLGQAVDGTTLDIGEARYTLRGFVQHRGPRMTTGHYVAYVEQASRWYRLNDSTVTPDPSDLVDARSHGYIYLFELQPRTTAPTGTPTTSGTPRTSGTPMTDDKIR